MFVRSSVYHLTELRISLWQTDRQTRSTLKTGEEIYKILFGESERKTQREKPGIN